jgi:hypothetical protein
MPAFILPIGERASAPKTFAALDYFTQGYVEAMFWTDCNSDSCDGLADATFSDLACEALKSLMEDCEAFQRDNEALLEAAYERGYTEEQAGHDYWLTRNRHGAGFWDRGELDAGGIGDKLSDMAHLDGSVDLYRGDDGKVYFS